MKKIMIVAGFALVTGIATGSQIPDAHADPNMCSISPGTPTWANPCTAAYPPWNSPGWSPNVGQPGTWGPNGQYTPCNKPSGFCY